MDPIIAYGLTASAIVVLIVQGAKWLGLPDKYAPWLALGLSAVLVGANLLVQFVPTAQQFVEAVVGAVLVFLTSVGLYHTGKNMGTSTGIVTDVPAGGDVAPPPPAV